MQLALLPRHVADATLPKARLSATTLQTFGAATSPVTGIPVSGINAGKVTLEYREFSQFVGSPTVNINMNNGKSGPEGDAVTGIKAGRLTVKDDAKLKIEVTGRNVKSSGESDSGGRVNRAISSGTMQVLDNASVDIISYKNVVTDIYLFGDGEALTVNTTGHLNIKNQSMVTFVDQSDDWNRRFGYPSDNIYLSENNATFKLEKAEGGFSIDSCGTTPRTSGEATISTPAPLM